MFNTSDKDNNIKIKAILMSKKCELQLSQELAEWIETKENNSNNKTHIKGWKNLYYKMLTSKEII